MSENRYAPDADQDPGRDPNLPADQTINGGTVADIDADPAGDPTADDSKGFLDEERVVDHGNGDVRSEDESVHTQQAGAREETLAGHTATDDRITQDPSNLDARADAAEAAARNDVGNAGNLISNAQQPPADR